MNYSNLSTYQLVLIYNKVPNAREDIRKEWRRRFALSFPYRMTVTGAVIDDLKGTEVEDDKIPSYILDQVNTLRERRKTNA